MSSATLLRRIDQSGVPQRLVRSMLSLIQDQEPIEHTASSLSGQSDAHGLFAGLRPDLHTNTVGHSRPGNDLLSGGAHVVTLTLAHPLIPASTLYEHLMPNGFGSWKDFSCKAFCAGDVQAVSLLKDAATGMEFAIIIPLEQQRSARKEVLRARTIRITCEAQRASLYSVRTVDGTLLAAGIMQPAAPTEQSGSAAFTRKLLRH